MKGEKILLATPLLKWYLEHGLEVTKVHQVIEFTPEPCFKPFGDAVSDARRAGDADPSKAIIADTMKVVRCCFVVGNKGREGKHFMDRKNLHKFYFDFSGGQFRLWPNDYQPIEAQRRGVLQRRGS